MRLLDCFSTGLIAVTKLDPSSKIIDDNYERIVAEFAPHADDFEKLQAFLSTSPIDSSRAIPPSELLRVFKG